MRKGATVTRRFCQNLFVSGLMVLATTAQAGTDGFEYDALGRLVKVTRSSGAETTYSYDPAGNRIEKATTGGSSAPAISAPRLYYRNTDGSVSTVLGTTVTNLGSYASGYTPRLISDLNGDGHKDILFQRSSDNEAGVFMTSGASVTSSGWTSTGSAQLLGSADFNDDDKEDFFLYAGGSVFAYHIKDGYSQIGGGGDGYTGVASYQAVGDYNGDGMAEVVFTRSDGTFASWMISSYVILYGWYWAPQWSWPTITYYPSSGSGWAAKAIADFTGDGKKDVLVQSSSGAFEIWDMTSAGQVNSHQSVAAVGSGWTFRGAVDVTGDGIAEILMSDGSGNLAAWWLNSGSLTNLGNLTTPSSTAILLTENALSS